jgi:hypothetical protein
MSVFCKVAAGAKPAAVAFCVLASVLAPAWADDAVPASGDVPSARARIEQALQHQEARRGVAIAGFVVGGAAIVAGSVASTVASSENRDDENAGRPKSHNPYAPYAVGLGVGLPILGLSGLLFADAQHQINLLRQQRFSLSYAPDTHQPVLQLSLGF